MTADYWNTRKNECLCGTPATINLYSNTLEDGARYQCAGCGRDWVHVCDEAEGCRWIQVSAPKAIVQ